MDMLYDFGLMILGAISIAIPGGYGAYILIKAEHQKGYTEGYMDGLKDATDKANTGVKEAQKYQ